ncbi:hypothetical protein BGZ57DRAFT_926143 [Hyaloscypha finlandica]|nr:hypothetical protein BGZ57DRAFT_926143 [Hyaloscypha finlandica]
MPNWKSYESSVRLLSAILAAHPGLKLDYNEVARFWGDGIKYKSCWDRCNLMHKNAKLLRDAVEAGLDPFQVELIDAPSKAQEIAARFGSDCTASALENRFRPLKRDAKLINDSIAKGIDPKTLPIGAETNGAEIARYFGSDATKSAIESVWKRQVRPSVKAITDALDQGGDPKDVNLLGTFWTGGKGASEIAKCYGTNCTKSGLDNHFKRDIRPNSKAIRDALARGDDPKDLAMMENVRDGKIGKEIVKFYGSRLTKPSLVNHLGRDISPNTKLLKEAVCRGEDPDSVILIEGVRSERAGKEIAKCFDLELKSGALQKHFVRNITPNVKLVQEARARGENPVGVTLIENVRDGKPGKQIARCFGKSATAKSIMHIFDRTIRPDVKLILETLKAGGDPEKLSLAGIAKISGGGKEIARCLDPELKPGTLNQHFNRNISPNVKLIKDALAKGENPMGVTLADVNLIKNARANGIDCKDVMLSGANKGSNSGSEISSIMGSDTTPNGIKFQFTDRFRPIAKRQLDMKAAGLDPKDVNLDSVKGKGAQDISKYFGSDSTSGGTQFVLRAIRANADRQRACADSGGDPKDLALNSIGSKQEMAKFIGSDCTKGALEWQFRRYKAGAKLQMAAVAAGQDPKNINVDVNPQGKPDGKGSGGTNSMSRLLKDGRTPSSLEHTFRPIKKEAEAMKAGTSIAREYGEGVTGKAVSTYFERARKDPNWNRANTTEENGSAQKNQTPRKRKAPAKKIKDEGDDDEEDTGSNFDETPTKKKATLHKVQSGRVKKPSPRSRAVPSSYAELSENDGEDGAVNEESIENGSDGFIDNGYHNGNGNGNADNGMIGYDDEDPYYDVQEEA